MIGNSLTGQAEPFQLSTDVDIHIRGATNLHYHYNNPQDGTGYNSSGANDNTWDVALVAKQYDFVIVQPFGGTTLDQDVDAISNWMALQPNATFVLYDAWGNHSTFHSDYNTVNHNGNMARSPSYYNDIVDGVELATGRSLVNANFIEYAYEVYKDIESGTAPYDDISDLYGDSIHPNKAGTYLIHNALRKAIGVPINTQSNLDSEEFDYLNSVLARPIPEPNAILLSVLGMGGLLSLRNRA